MGNQTSSLRGHARPTEIIESVMLTCRTKGFMILNQWTGLEYLEVVV